ncbi:TetR/AcrR family transcriptional regulator [Nocardioides campestrisoli]|uniref:TetR/AcrR family transcriptional regulator n=1 Tax=Nocardioides campestrisoli TaxID=2736757 RepID=UPI00163DAF31|nr:TetR/AcrR family transcriptional regulator [Nocardioides campestrisoli]
MSDAHPHTRDRGSAARTRAAERTPGGDARTQILRAAGRLLAEKGLEGVSFREITRSAGQKNTTALQYHFGDREGLLRAHMDLHVPRVSVRRHALLDHLTARGDVTLREAAGILVTPLVTELQDEYGADFLQVAAHLVNRSEALVDPDGALGALVYDPAGSLERWSVMVEPLMPPGTAGPPLHRRFAAMRFTHIELGRRARMAAGQPSELFASQLVDLVTSILGAGISPETSRLLEERNAERH